MHLSVASYGFAFLAGVLSTLSPCVLPIVPILLSTAATAHRRAPLALAAGLALSYAILGTILAWAGSALSIDSGIFRYVAAIVLGLFGIILLSASLQERFAMATSGIGNAGNNLIARVHLDGLAGQFVIGLVLGVVWSPCVGPTLGSAIVLASQGKHLAQAAIVMAIFGVGAALPVVVLAYVSRSAMTKMRGRLLAIGKTGKYALGTSLIVVALLIVTGVDKRMETWLVANSPPWLNDVTTRF